MAYTINSAKDSLGDEHEFLANFAANQAQIEQYKQSRGGDYEGAYQAVTGQPWPAGRSVKVKNGVPEMTKDRTTKSVLGKYVALPAAIAAGGYFAAPALAGLAGVGGAASGATAAGATGVGLGETAAVMGLAGSGFGGTAAGLGSVAGGLGAAGKVAGGLSTVGRLAQAGQSLAGAGKPISDASAAAGNQRRNEANFDISAMNSYENALMNRAQLEGGQRKDALKDVYRSSYAKNAKPGPNNARGLTAYSPEYLQSLADLEGQGTARLSGVADYSTPKMKPLVTAKAKPAGTLEQAGSWVGPTLSGIGTAARLYGDFMG